MSVWVTLTMNVQEGAYAKLETFLAEKLPAVRSFDGALSVSIMFDAGTNALMLLEEWKSREHHQAYIASISQNGVMEQLLSFMTGAPDVQYYERVLL